MKKVYAALLTLVALAVVTAGSALADTWGDQINDPSRFVVLPGYNGTAVLDQETGLVWERSPTVDLSTGGLIWVDAQALCNQQVVGNRKGWRLPTVQELASLIDPTVPSPTFRDPTLPAGHPFSNVTANAYWSATTFANGTRMAWSVFFRDGGVVIGSDRISTFLVWCVRGGHGVDPQ